MIHEIRNWYSTHKELAYPCTAIVSGGVALAAWHISALSFPLTIIAALSAGQAAIHIGNKNLWSSRNIKTFSPIGLGLIFLGTIAMPITVGWGMKSVFYGGDKIQRVCLLVGSFATAKFLGIPKFP